MLGVESRDAAVHHAVRVKAAARFVRVMESTLLAGMRFGPIALGQLLAVGGNSAPNDHMSCQPGRQKSKKTTISLTFQMNWE